MFSRNIFSVTLVKSKSGRFLRIFLSAEFFFLSQICQICQIRPDLPICQRNLTKDTADLPKRLNPCDGETSFLNFFEIQHSYPVD